MPVCAPGKQTASPGLSSTLDKQRALAVLLTHDEHHKNPMRMAIRRFTRLTNAFSKKLVNLKAACALHFAYYNFCRVHQTLRVTPAMEAGLTDHVWELKQLLAR